MEFLYWHMRQNDCVCEWIIENWQNCILSAVPYWKKGHSIRLVSVFFRWISCEKYKIYQYKAKQYAWRLYTNAVLHLLAIYLEYSIKLCYAHSHSSTHLLMPRAQLILFTLYSPCKTSSSFLYNMFSDSDFFSRKTFSSHLYCFPYFNLSLPYFVFVPLMTLALLNIAIGIVQKNVTNGNSAIKLLEKRA